MAVCTSMVALSALVYLEVASTAFANIGWKFYMVFISITAVGLAWVYFVLPETTGLPLEEVAALFGDQDEVMVFSDDIQSGSVAGEPVIKEHGQARTETDEADKAGVPAHREVVELNVL